MMVLYVFVGICVLGVDFMIYVLLKWIYGDTREALARKLAAQRLAMQGESARPFLVSSGKNGTLTQERIRKVRERMTRRSA